MPTCDSVARRRSRTVVNNSSLVAEQAHAWRPNSLIAERAISSDWLNPLSRNLLACSGTGMTQNRLRFEAGKQGFGGFGQPAAEHARGGAHLVILEQMNQSAQLIRVCSRG